MIHQKSFFFPSLFVTLFLLLDGVREIVQTLHFIKILVWYLCKTITLELAIEMYSSQIKFAPGMVLS